MTGPEAEERDLSEDEAARAATYQERRIAARWSAIGIQFGVSIAIGTIGGQWLDERFDTEPWLLVAGIVLGSFAAFWDVYRLVRRTNLK